MLNKSLKLLFADGDTNLAFLLFCALGSKSPETDLQSSVLLMSDVHLEMVMFATRLTRLLLAYVAFVPWLLPNVR